MTIEKRQKLKNLMRQWPTGAIGTSEWLHGLRISDTLAKYYAASGWLESLGQGAYRRSGEEVTWYGALASLQKQTNLMAHVGGPTTLALKGRSHYLRKNAPVFLFALPKIILPKWYREYNWGLKVKIANTSFLPTNLGVSKYTYQGMDLQVSSPERAILECLYLTQKYSDLTEVYQLLLGLRDLRPKVMQSLLEICNSVKIKRLFLLLAEKADLPVLKHLDLTKIDLGAGPRSVVKGGIFDPKYQINLPKELYYLGKNRN